MLNYIFAAFLILLIILLLFLRIKCIVRYVLNDSYDVFSISLFTLKGVFKYKYEVSLLDNDKSRKKFRLEKESGVIGVRTEKDRKKLELDEIYIGLEKAGKYYHNNYKELCEIRDIFKRKVMLETLDIEVTAGTYNAFGTALACGVLWSLTGYIASLLLNIFSSFKKRILINPNYRKKVLSVNAYCILKAKLVYIIMLLIIIRSTLEETKHEKNADEKDEAGRLGKDEEGGVEYGGASD